MNGRRGFMKIITGALVASAIEIRLAAAPIIEKIPTASFDPLSYVGEFKWVNCELHRKTQMGELKIYKMNQ